MNQIILLTLLIYLVVLGWIGFRARARIHGSEDYVVAGRRLPLLLASATLFATWFGAGTLLTATDEIRRGGVERMALEPLGSGVCLLLAGFFFARPLWRMGLLTLADFFARRFGTAAEVVAVLIMVPSYFGWIAVQFLALAGILELACGLNMTLGLLLVALVSSGYTWLGGMWSVVLTDALQVVLMIIGLIVLAVAVLGAVGPEGSVLGGLSRLFQETPGDFLRPIPTESLGSLIAWLNVFCIAALGNIPTQDLMQRVFASRTEVTAQRACWIAGFFYLVFGTLPVMLAVSSTILLPTASDAVVAALAQLVLSPILQLLFILTLISAILSTVDSAILAPSATLALNLLPKVTGWKISAVSRTRFAIVFVSAASLLVAFLGGDAYGLLESAYALPLVGLLVPLSLGLRRASGGQTAAVLSMFAGVGLWMLHSALGWTSFFQPWLGQVFEFPVAMTATVAGLVVYLMAETFEKAS